ncbi:ATP-binding protein [Brevirhabdus sp.]|uniref:ATP-binding protein n=1 Tax=Brevirhabdus sp. TaxID=2004514 RepID=UPI0040589163
MVSFNLLIAVAVAYVAALFGVAFWAENRARRGQDSWLRSPLIYTLSLSVYCTAWTFYGAVGYAARSGLEFVTIYLGPTLVFVGWWWVLRKLVRIGRTQRVTSIADLVSSRFGKSNALAVIVTLLAVTGTTPYIALQLQSVALSVAVFAPPSSAGWGLGDANSTAIWVAGGLTVFTILFGTRNLDANERHHGVVMAIAVEAVVKLFALLAVGVFVVWGVAGGAGDMLARIDASPLAATGFVADRWIGLTFLSAAAVVCLPRMFQVLVVENADERHLNTAAWAFPAYLMAMSLFVVPIAVVGMDLLPAQSNPDLFVLTLPLSQGRGGLAMLAFLGGFSSATSMVIVASIALSTMVSNHIVMPLWLNLKRGGATMSGDVRNIVLLSRRISIGAVLLLGYGYFRLSGGGTALAAIGLISFAGVAQILPALLGGIFWRGATRWGAAAGLLAGFALWAYTLFLPSFGAGAVFSPELLAQGSAGIGWLRPQALMGLGGLDPLVHALIWSIGVNATLFIVISLVTFPTPLERLQGAQMVNVFEHSTRAQGWTGSLAEAEDLLVMSQRIIGAKQAQALFQDAAARQGKSGYLPDPTPQFIEHLERQLAGSVGAATAHAMVGQITGGSAVSVQDLLAVADETAQMREYSSQLEAKSDELARAARQLRTANEKLTEISIQKDAFLSQISHELRTPMTSIRAFAEILRDSEGLGEGDLSRYSAIIHDESIRLTRLLDDLLDLSVLEHGQVVLHRSRVALCDVLDRAEASAGQGGREGGKRDGGQGLRLRILRDRAQEAQLLDTDADRLAQVFINLIGNARKYCAADEPQLRITARGHADRLEVDFIDNGTGIPEKSQAIIFEKFTRLSDESAAGSAGLGLAICREIMTKLGGTVTYLPGQGGAAFRVVLPLGAG